MCGRYTMSDPERCLEEFSILEKHPSIEPRYNVTPSQGVWVLRMLDVGGEKRLDLLRWGLVRRAGAGSDVAMVRAESLTTRPAFMNAFRARRCLFLADGFYEWRRAGKKSFPHYFRRPGGAAFAMAGIWQPAPPTRPGPDEPTIIDACAVITRPALAPVEAVHDRMPAIVAPEHHEAWLDPAFADADALLGILAADPGFSLESREIGTHVNSPANDDPSCIAPATEADRRGEQFDLFTRSAAR